MGTFYFLILIDKTMDLSKIESSMANISDPFDTKNRKPMFSLFGFSELSVLDLFMGFASGVFGTNVREEWHECMGGPLTMFRDILKLTMEFISGLDQHRWHLLQCFPTYQNRRHRRIHLHRASKVR